MSSRIDWNICNAASGVKGAGVGDTAPDEADLFAAHFQRVGAGGVAAAVEDAQPLRIRQQWREYVADLLDAQRVEDLVVRRAGCRGHQQHVGLAQWCCERGRVCGDPCGTALDARGGDAGASGYGGIAGAAPISRSTTTTPDTAACGHELGAATQESVRYRDRGLRPLRREAAHHRQHRGASGHRTHPGASGTHGPEAGTRSNCHSGHEHHPRSRGCFDINEFDQPLRPVHHAAGQGGAVSAVGKQPDREINETGGGRSLLPWGNAGAPS